MKERSKPQGLCQLFGQRVRELRTRQGLTQRELARRAGMHPAYVGGVERGERNVTLEVVERLARALQVSPAELMLDGSDPLSGIPQARLQALLARARDPAQLALALDVAGYLLERLASWQRRGLIAAEPPGPYS